MLQELFITHCTNGISIMNPFTFMNIYVSMYISIYGHVCIYMLYDCKELGIYRGGHP